MTASVLDAFPWRPVTATVYCRRSVVAAMRSDTIDCDLTHRSRAATFAHSEAEMEATLQRQTWTAQIFLRNRVPSIPRRVARHQRPRLKRGNDICIAAAPEIMRCSQSTQGQEESAGGRGRCWRHSDGRSTADGVQYRRHVEAQTA